MQQLGRLGTEGEVEEHGLPRLSLVGRRQPRLQPHPRPLANRGANCRLGGEQLVRQQSNRCGA